MERASRHERGFKALIVLTTSLVILSIAWSSPWARYGAATAASEVRQVARRVIGLPTPRSEIDAAWARSRQLGIESSRRGLDQLYAELDPPMRRLMRYAGLDPENGLLRWGNFDRTLLLPSTIFEPDDGGRSYHFRPQKRSIWLRNITLRTGVLMFFLVPDGPGLADATRGTAAIPVETSRQFTNSWGLRGPEPDLDAPVRGIVLGDSYMQGMFIGDDETPSECLRRYLKRELKTPVSILNTGVLGYSPEQYYYSLVAFAKRFRPQFVVVSIFTNDFGDVHEVPSKGLGDWEEGKYWLDKIVEFCRGRKWPHLIVAAPYEPSMLSKRKTGFYPGMISNILGESGLLFLDPTDDFINAHLEMVLDGEKNGRRPSGCPLFNDVIADGHFSAAGSEVWAQSVGRRLVLLLKKDRVLPTNPAQLHHEKAMDPANPQTAARPAPAARAAVRRAAAAT
jgi:hypothetical protein